MKWYKCQTLNTPSIRGAHSATILSNNKMIIFGGYEGNSHLSDMHLLDLGIVFLSEPHILSSKSKFDFVRKSWFCLLFWTETMKWTKLVSGGMSAPSPRRGHSASLIGHNIYFFGGYNGSSVFNDLFRFDCSKWPINKTQFFCFFFSWK